MKTNRSGGGGRPRSAVRWLVAAAAPRTPPLHVGAEGSDADIGVKRGANIAQLSPNIVRTYRNIVAAWRGAKGPTPVITSGNDGKHKAGSRHYDNEAIDLRCNNICDEQCERITKALQGSLGPDYDVIFERFPKAPQRDHIHLEHDPKAVIGGGPRSASPSVSSDTLETDERMARRSNTLAVS